MTTMKIKDHPRRAPCCYSQIHDCTKNSAKKHPSKESRRSRNQQDQKGVVPSNTKKGRSFRGAQKVNNQGHIHLETDSTSATLTTVSVSSSDSSYFHAGESKDKCFISTDPTQITKPYGRTHEWNGDAHEKDSAAVHCNNISICSTKNEIPKLQHLHMQLDRRTQMKIQKIVEQLLMEDNIAMKAWDEVAFEYHRRIEPFTSLFVPHLLNPTLLYSSFSEERPRSIRVRGDLSGKSVLDIGAGTGAGALYAASRNSSFVMATDFSENMLKVLQSRIDASHCRNIQTRTANGLFLPFTWKNQYDVVFSNFALVYFPRVKEGISEMVRCAKQGGKVCISGWGSKEETQAFSIFPKAIMRCGFDRTWCLAQSAALKQQFPRRRNMNSKKSLAPNYFCPTRRKASSQHYLHALMLEAGLVNVQVIPVTKKLRFDNVEGYWNRFVLSSPNLKRFVDHCLSPEEISTLKRTVTEILQEESPGRCKKGGVALKATAYVAVGTKTCATKQRG